MKVGPPCASVYPHNSLYASCCETIASEISSNVRAILTVLLAEFLLEIAFLAQHDAEMHRDENRHQENQSPPRVEGEGEADVQKRESDVERIAGITERTRRHDSRCRLRRTHVRAGSYHRSSSGNQDRKSEQYQDQAEPQRERIAADRHR